MVQVVVVVGLQRQLEQDFARLAQVVLVHLVYVLYFTKEK
jgi:hypothetical protein